jgi:hypothetical protein
VVSGLSDSAVVLTKEAEKRLLLNKYLLKTLNLTHTRNIGKVHYVRL